MGNKQVRLLNCLLTIVELEPWIRKLPFDSDLNAEFKYIKKIIKQVKDFDLTEEDVWRIEKATADFLDEIREPLSFLVKKKQKDKLQ